MPPMNWLKPSSSLLDTRQFILWSDDFTLSMTVVIFKPPPPVGADGGYMFSGRPSVPPFMRPFVRLSMIHVVVLCFHDISSIC